MAMRNRPINEQLERTTLPSRRSILRYSALASSVPVATLLDPLLQVGAAHVVERTLGLYAPSHRTHGP